MQWIFGAILTTAGIILGASMHNAMGSTGLVSILEMRYGAPGTMHVLPECSCTVKYLGTTVQGRDYAVHFRQMD